MNWLLDTLFVKQIYCMLHCCCSSVKTKRKRCCTVSLRKSYHSVYSLNYHLILVTKYRQKVITDDICEYLKELFIKIADNHGISIMEFNHDVDHIHILFSASPTTSLSKFINSFKSASSRKVKTQFPETKAKLWEEMFWSRSYYLSTCGELSMDSVQRYIQNQGENH